VILLVIMFSFYVFVFSLHCCFISCSGHIINTVLMAFLYNFTMYQLIHHPFWISSTSSAQHAKPSGQEKNAGACYTWAAFT
jgi:hypothetical protein